MLISVLLDENVGSVADVFEFIEADCEGGVVLVRGKDLFDGGTRAPRDELAVFLCLLYCLVEDGFWD